MLGTAVATVHALRMHDTPDDASGRRRAWSGYWASGRLHSCATSFEGNYAGVIGRFWEEAFAPLQPGSRVLDLASGNGALPAMLWQMHQGAVQVDAVDLAEVAPGWIRPAHDTAIRFHPGVDMEALPFAGASFDCVASQFGFEYANRERALAEACRVAAADGRLRLVMHHHDSRLVQVGREELAHHQRLAADDGLLPAARAVVAVLAAVRGGRPPDTAALQAREHYNLALAALARAAEASFAPDLLLETREAVHRQVAAVGVDPAPALDALERLAADLAHARLRTVEMVECALDRAQLDALLQAVRQARPQWQVAGAELAQAEGVLAWSLAAGPAAG